MSAEKSSAGSIAGRLIRGWPIVLAGALTGLALGVVFGFATAPSGSFATTARVRYVASAYAPLGVPNANTVVALALSPNVQGAAATSAGIDAASFGDAVQAAVDPRDGTIAIITVTDAREDASARKAQALAAATIDEALKGIGQPADAQRARIEAERAMQALRDARITQLQTQLEQAASLSRAEQTQLQDSLLEQQVERAEMELRLMQDELILGQLQGLLQPVGEPATTTTGPKAYVISNSLRGLLLGLVAGVVVAALARRKESVGP